MSAVDRDRQKALQRLERARDSRCDRRRRRRVPAGQPAPLGRFDETRNRVDLVVADDLRQKELGVKDRARRGNRPAARDPRAGWPSRRGPGCSIALPQHAAAAATRARPIAACRRCWSPPRTTSAGKPFWRARSAYDRQYSRECFAVRNGTMRERGTSLPEIGHEMAQVVFFLRADGAVGEKHERTLRASAGGRRDTYRSTRPCPRSSRARRAADAAPRRTTEVRRSEARSEDRWRSSRRSLHYTMHAR